MVDPQGDGRGWGLDLWWLVDPRERAGEGAQPMGAGRSQGEGIPHYFIHKNSTELAFQNIMRRVTEWLRLQETGFILENFPGSEPPNLRPS